MFVGTATHCAGCGRFGGVFCLVIIDDYISGSADPDWPFPEDDCPICQLRQRLEEVSHLIDNPPWPRGKPRPLP